MRWHSSQHSQQHSLQENMLSRQQWPTGLQQPSYMLPMRARAR